MRHFKLLNALYKRNQAKNVLITIFLTFTNLILMLFVLFFGVNDAIIPTLSRGYLEHLSVEVSSFSTLKTNNELISVKNYRRPNISELEQVKSEVGEFDIRPDYLSFLSSAEFRVFNKIVETPMLILTNLPQHTIGINTKYYEYLQKEVEVKNNNFQIDLNLTIDIINQSELVTLKYFSTVDISFIYEEPNFLSSNKIYFPMSFLDDTLGSLKVGETSFTNFLFALPDDHDYTNHRYRLILTSEKQKQRLINKLTRNNNDDNGIEISSDEINKVNSFSALFSYISILLVIFLVFTFIASLIINIVIAHTSLTSNLRQYALLSLLNAKKETLYAYNLSVMVFNFSVSLSGLFFIKPIINIFEQVLGEVLNIKLTLPLNLNLLILIYSFNFLFIFLIVTILFVVNLRRPLLYLLIDA